MDLRLVPLPHALVALLLAPSVLGAQQPYRDLPAAQARMLDAPPSPLVVLSPDRSKFLLLERPSLAPIAEVARPVLRLAGRSVNPLNNSAAGVETYSALVVQPIGRGETRRMVIPWKARVGSALWSPDGKRVALTFIEETGTSLWIADAGNGDVRMLVAAVLNGALGAPCQWLSGSSGLLCSRIAGGRTPTRPSSGGSAQPVSLEDDQARRPAVRGPGSDEDLEHYLGGQLILVPLSGPEQAIGTPGIHVASSVSPDGRYLLVATVHPPYSPGIPLERLPTRTEVLDLATGAVVRVVGDRGLLDKSALVHDAVPGGPRDVEWRADRPAALCWFEAQDGGDPAQAATVRDKLFQLESPFGGNPTVLASMEFRGQSVVWAQHDQAILSEAWSEPYRRRSWILSPERERPPRLLLQMLDPRGPDPGAFMTTAGADGHPVLLTTRSGREAFLSGIGASPDGDRPFLDRVDLGTGKSTRLWRSEASYYEEPVTLLDADMDLVITRRESPRDPPNYFVRDLRKRFAIQLTQLTRFPDPTPEFARIGRVPVSYTRADGTQLSATLYLPPGYATKRAALPLVLWVRPVIYASQRSASQAHDSPNRFVRPSGASPLFFAFSGYAVLDGATMPLVGPGAGPTDAAYLKQIVANAEAAIARVVAMGIADPKRIAVGGESDGAKVSSDLLTRSTLFKAGVGWAPGALRPIRPFGPEVEPRAVPSLLLIEGMSEDGSAISPRRLVLLPGESYPWRARESAGHALYETTVWLDRFLKAAPPP